MEQVLDNPHGMATIVALSTESLRTVRDDLSEMVDRVERHHARLVVTRNGRPAAVLIGRRSQTDEPSWVGA